MARIAEQSSDFAQWYLDVIREADLAEHADVRGCIIFKPYGYALWEAVQQEMNTRIKAMGVDNVYFPLFIPESLLTKEKDHIEGFAPECAVVTHGGGKELQEKLYVRPTSETIIYSTFAKWVQSYRDLPIRINQWANVVRWEMRTRPFLRTLEFLWQEGHTCHASEEEANAMMQAALDMYATFDREVLAIPVLCGDKPAHERFAGAQRTVTTEALAKDGKAIQAGTSHQLGQGFSEAYDVSFLDEQGKSQRPWMTSWGISTRIIGTLIVVHGDEKGLRIPPRIAPIQAVIVPIYKTEEEQESVCTCANNLAAQWSSVRVRTDLREDKTPGYKFNEWEVKGIPLRIEIGPRDLQKNQATVVRRDTGEKHAVSLSELTDAYICTLLEKIQDNMLEQAEEYLASHTYTEESKEQILSLLTEQKGMVWAPWDGTLETAMLVQEKTKASIRLVKADGVKADTLDPFSGKPAVQYALYAKAY